MGVLKCLHLLPSLPDMWLLSSPRNPNEPNESGSLFSVDSQTTRVHWPETYATSSATWCVLANQMNSFGHAHT